MWLDTGVGVTTAVPAGTSTSKYEALELRDGDESRHLGKGVLKAVDNVNTKIASKVIGMDPVAQGDIDKVLIELDGTENKKNLGANAILAVSQAACKAGAAAYNIPLYQYIFTKYRLKPDIRVPTPVFNLINGGKHGAGNLDFQEFHLIPSSRFPYHQALLMGVEIYHMVEQVLINNNAIHSVGAEGGFAPNLFTNVDALEAILEATRMTNFNFGHDVFLGLDVAASNFYSNGKYTIKDRSQAFSSKEFMAYYVDLNERYHLFSLEDPLDEDDWDEWAELTAQLGGKTMVVGDDLLSTNKEKVAKAIKHNSCTAILVKPNQIGTITETVEVISQSLAAKWSVIASHRSGETTDSFIADFAVGVGADYAKFGAPARGERVVKYNRLLQIASELSTTQVAGPDKPNA